VARLLRSCRALLKEDAKALAFGSFVGLADGVERAWPLGKWVLFLRLLHCIRTLLGGSWKQYCKCVRPPSCMDGRPPPAARCPP